MISRKSVQMTRSPEQPLDSALPCRRVYVGSVQGGGGNGAAASVQGLQREAHPLCCSQAYPTPSCLCSRAFCCLLPSCLPRTSPGSAEVRHHLTVRLNKHHQSCKMSVNSAVLACHHIERPAQQAACLQLKAQCFWLWAA